MWWQYHVYFHFEGKTCSFCSSLHIIFFIQQSISWVMEFLQQCLVIFLAFIDQKYKALISMKLFITRLKSEYLKKFFPTFLGCFSSTYTHKVVWKWGVKNSIYCQQKLLIIQARNHMQQIKMLVNTLSLKNVILRISRH